MLDTRLLEMLDEGVFTQRLNVRGNPIGFGPANKYLVHQKTGISVDVFSTSVENWGMALVVRTGPAEFNRMIFSEFLKHGMRAHASAGATLRDGREVDCPTEQSVFDLIQWPYVPPIDRERWV